MTDLTAMLPSVQMGESPRFLLRHEFIEAPERIQYGFSRVGKDYTQWRISATASLIESANGYEFEAESARELEPGLYQVTHLTWKLGEAPESSSLAPRDFGSCVFEIRKDGEPESTPAELAERLKRILEAREEEFLSGMGSGSRRFSAFVFVTDLLLRTPMRLGRLEVLPQPGLAANDELYAMRRFFTEHTAINLGDTTEQAERARRDQPSFVIHLPHVRGDTVEAAAETALHEAELVVLVLSRHRGGAGEVYGSVFYEHGTGQIWYRIRTQTYKGNLLGGIISGEDPEAIRSELETIRESERGRVYASMFREALRERDSRVLYFRFWNILETVARGQDYVGKEKRNWKGGIVNNRRGEPQLIQDTAEDLVLELIRAKLAHRNVSERAFGQQTGNKTFEELVPIWYQRRCCVVHGGPCPCRDPLEIADKEKKQRCLDARQEHQDSPVDPYLDALKNTVENVLQVELRTLDVATATSESEVRRVST